MSGVDEGEARRERPDVFISYASPDLTRAAKLDARLSSAGLSVWFDRARLEPGCRWHREIEVACEATRVMLPLITPNWQKSEWTRYETYAHSSVIPVLAEGRAEEVLPVPLRGLNGIPLDPMTASEDQWQKLLGAIRNKLVEPVPERTPRLVDLPYEANPYFTGRENDLVRIHEELHTAPVAALKQGRVLVLAGMGGIGKTTVANEYARRCWRLYPQILWVDARRGYQVEFARLFDRLFPDRAASEIKPVEKAALALARLNDEAERLLVIDNAEDGESVRPWLPRQATSGCRTLITSRFSDFPQAANIRVVPLYLLEPEQALEFLAKRTERAAEGDERVACEALTKELGCLPLALEQAGAFIAASVPRVTFADYLRLFQQATENLLARKALGSTDYPDAVIATWQTTVAKLPPEARAVLRLCAWLADTPIPNAYVLDGVDDVLALAAAFGDPVPRHASRAETELTLRDALGGLARYSMILDVTQEGFRLHGLVQAVERIEAKRAGQDADARERALDRLRTLFPPAYDDPSVWPLCRQLIPHQQAMVGRFASDHVSVGMAVLLSRAGVFLYGSGDASPALPLLRRALESRKRVLGEEHPDTLESVNDLVNCLLGLSDASSALPLCRRALESRERVLGKEHPQTLTSVNSLADCLGMLGEASSALPLYRRALESRERVLGNEHPDTLVSVNNLAGCLERLRDASSALPLYRRALESRERVLGKEHPDTLSSVNNLAACVFALGDASSALPLFRRALESRERVLGKEHPETLVSVNNLADYLQSTGNAPSALPLFRRALESSERVLGRDHLLTLISANNLAGCLQAMGDASSALPLFRLALENCERVLGKEHPHTVRIRRNVARCRQMLSRNGPAGWWHSAVSRMKGWLGNGKS